MQSQCMCIKIKFIQNPVWISQQTFLDTVEDYITET